MLKLLSPLRSLSYKREIESNTLIGETLIYKSDGTIYHSEDGDDSPWLEYPTKTSLVPTFGNTVSISLPILSYSSITHMYTINPYVKKRCFLRVSVSSGSLNIHSSYNGIDWNLIHTSLNSGTVLSVSKLYYYYDSNHTEESLVILMNEIEGLRLYSFRYHFNYPVNSETGLLKLLTTISHNTTIYEDAYAKMSSRSSGYFLIVRTIKKNQTGSPFLHGKITYTLSLNSDTITIGNLSNSIKAPTNYMWRYTVVNSYGISGLGFFVLGKFNSYMPQHGYYVEYDSPTSASIIDFTIGVNTEASNTGIPINKNSYPSNKFIDGYLDNNIASNMFYERHDSDIKIFSFTNRHNIARRVEPAYSSYGLYDVSTIFFKYNNESNYVELGSPWAILKSHYKTRDANGVFREYDYYYLGRFVNDRPFEIVKQLARTSPTSSVAPVFIGVL